jgi:hypothetical protein
MKRNVLFTLFLCVIVTLSLGSQLAQAQDAEPELIRVSGTYDYTPTILAALELDGVAYMDAVDEEVWSGDFEGTAVSGYRIVIESSGVWDAPIITEFEGTVLGDKEGTMVMVFTYKRMSATSHWFGEWWILSGTGDLANIHGRGVVWGPGWNPEDPEASPDVFYSGEIILVEPPSD